VETLEERRLLAACDPNDDDQISRIDIAILAKNLGNSEGASEREGDCNGDGSIDVFDLALMQEQLLDRRLDWGDAPDRPYPTRFASNGARHVIKANFHLGAAIDRDPNGQPSLLANGDDTDADGDDEDGVLFLTPAIPGVPQRIRVDASAPGLLDAFFDFNRDGDWNDAGEQVFANLPLVAGMNFLSHVVPAGAITDTAQPTYARFRFSSAGGLTPTGAAPDGEVEDYAPLVLDRTDVPAPIDVQALWDWEMQLEDVSIDPPALVMLEATGPVVVRLGPPVDTDTGRPIDLRASTLYGLAHYHIDIELLEMRLTGTSSEPDAQMGSHRVHQPIAITMRADQTSPGQGFLRSIDGGQTWSLDTHFDIAFRIDFLESGMSITPADGSVRFVSDGVSLPANWPAVKLMDGVLGMDVAASEIGKPLVEFDPPHTKWGNLRGLTTQVPLLDWGDAPDPTYPTLAASTGAAHVIRPGYSMGATVDAEANGQPSPLATRDDTSGVPDDEDGVAFKSAIVPGGTTKVDVIATGGAGFLNAWIDFNRDGDWDDAGEQVFTSELLSPGVNSLSFAVPTAAVPDLGVPTFSRWRLSRQAALGPRGLDSSGEVEDMAIFITPAVAVPAPAVVLTPWEWELEWEELSGPGDGPTATVLAEVAGPAEFRVGPAVHTDTGRVVEFFDPGSLPFEGRWLLPLDLEAMRLSGIARKGAGNDILVETITIVHEGLEMGDSSGNVVYVSTAGGGVWHVEDGFLDMAYRMDFGSGMSLMPEGGSQRLVAEIGPVPAVNAFITFFDKADGEPLVNVDPPHERWDILRRVATGPPRRDYGDLPDRPYATLLAGDGARHTIRPGFHLGTAIDADLNGQPDAAARRDDLNGLPDDEDGVFFLTAPTPGAPQRVRVDASAAGLLDAFIDFTRDGDFDDAGEHIFASQPLVAGMNFLSYVVPAGTPTSETAPTYARFRFSSAGGLSPAGPAADGEVEDYALFIHDPRALPPPIEVPVPAWDWVIEADRAATATEPSTPVLFEAAGSAIFELSPPVNTDNGMVFDLGGPDTLPPGSWHIDTELLEMNLTGTVHEVEFCIPFCPPPPPPPSGPRIEPCFISSYQIGGDASSGAMLLSTLPDGTWTMDSFFDITYRIDLPQSDISLVPEGGSTHMFSNHLTGPAPEPLIAQAIARNDVITAEFRFRRSSNASVWGTVDQLVTSAPALDWGDAPDRPYPTLAASVGAAHVIRPGYSMGPAIDLDANGQPHPIALGDDGDAGGDDEDGVVFTSPMFPGSVTTASVTAVGGRGYLNGWIDFNRNGVWEAGEHIFTDVLLNVGVNVLTFTVPTTTLPDSTSLPPVISRWRFSRQSGLPTTGLSSSGEVEDHLLRIAPRPQTSPEAPAAAIAAVDRAMSGVARPLASRLRVATASIIRAQSDVDRLPSTAATRIHAVRRAQRAAIVDRLLSGND
jgi:hypothetical protein